MWLFSWPGPMTPLSCRLTGCDAPAAAQAAHCSSTYASIQVSGLLGSYFLLACLLVANQVDAGLKSHLIVRSCCMRAGAGLVQVVAGGDSLSDM